MYKYKLKEISTSSDAGSYSTPFAFSKKKKYSYKLKDGFKLAPIIKENTETDIKFIESLKITDPELKKFITKRIEGFTLVEQKLNELLPLLKQAKKETLEQYSKTQDYKVLYGTDLAVEFLDDLIKLFTNPQNT